MSEPIPGTSYTRNGIQFTVQFVERGCVYGVRYRADVALEEINAAIDAGREPPGYLGNCRISLEDFDSEVAGASVELPSPLRHTGRVR